MKFTPETLLQIYLDGSFTEEAQAEFDALMRQDPAFCERVTQAVAERVGPVSDAKIDETASRLDGKMDAVWSRYKPSPALRALRLSGKIAFLFASAGVLYFGARHLWPLVQASLCGRPSAGLLTAESQPVAESLSPMQPAGEATLTARPEKKKHAAAKRAQASPTPRSGMKSPMTGGAAPSVAGSSDLPVPPAAALNRRSGAGSNLPLAANAAGPSAMNGQNTSGPTGDLSPNPVSQAPLPALPALSAGPSAPAEGDSLRVSIDTPKTQDVIVTVYDGNGLLIRHLYQGILGAGEHYVDWDGKDEWGNAVLPGDYTVVLDLGGKKMSGILKVLPVK